MRHECDVLDIDCTLASVLHKLLTRTHAHPFQTTKMHAVDLRLKAHYIYFPAHNPEHIQRASIFSPLASRLLRLLDGYKMKTYRIMQVHYRPRNSENKLHRNNRTFALLETHSLKIQKTQSASIPMCHLITHLVYGACWWV